MSDSSATEPNEEELRTRFVGQISAAFPLLSSESISIERHLSLKLGHHELQLDGFKHRVAGRYDLLVRVAGAPMLLIELKAPDVTLSEDDVAQAVSYARLMDPMPPIAAVMNGTDTRVVRTFDRAALDPSEVSAEALRAALSSAGTIAASAAASAIRSLLANDPRGMAAVFSRWTSEALASLTGPRRRLGMPMVEGFQIPRRISRTVGASVGRHAIQVVSGPPLSGVTNAVSQVPNNIDHGRPCLFVPQASGKDVLRHVANRLSREFKLVVSSDQVRGWLNTWEQDDAPVFVIDGWPADGQELVDLAEAGALRLVFGLEDALCDQLSRLEGRGELTALGRLAEVRSLTPLDDAEFSAAMQLLHEQVGACFMRGADYNEEWRLPRRLRVAVAMLPTRRLPDGGIYLMLPLASPLSIEAPWRAWVTDPQVGLDLEHLADAYLEELRKRKHDVDWMAATWGVPTLDPRDAENALGEQRLQRLQSSGFLRLARVRGQGVRLVVRVEELLYAAAASSLANALAESANNEELQVILRGLLDVADLMPWGDLVAAKAIVAAAHKNELVLGVAVPALLHEPPIVSRVGEGAVLELLNKGAPRIRLRFGEGMDEEMVGRRLPWLVLSQLCALPFEVVGYEGTGNFGIFVELGSSTHFLAPARPASFRDAPGFHFHELGALGSVLCPQSGLVEPLTQALLTHAGRFPDEFERLAQVAVEERRFHLAWRLHLVATMLADSDDLDVASRVLRTLGPWIGEEVAGAVAGADEERAHLVGSMRGDLHQDGHTQPQAEEDRSSPGDES